MPSIIRKLSCNRSSSPSQQNEFSNDKEITNSSHDVSLKTHMFKQPRTKRLRLEMKLQKLEQGQKVNLSFAGCGFLGLYHLGVAQCLIKNGKRFLENVSFFAGASAGSLVAAILCIDATTIDKAISTTFDLAKIVHSKKLGVLTPNLSILDPLKDSLNELLPENCNAIANKRLCISITTNRRPRKNVLINEFTDKNDLIQCLLASSYVPHITGTAPIDFRGEKYIDGGITDNLPIIENGLRTITVSPFSGTQDICPNDDSSPNLHLNILKQDFRFTSKNIKRGKHALFPPNNLHRYIKKGERDATAFLKYMDLYDDNVVDANNETQSVSETNDVNFGISKYSKETSI